MTQPKLALGSRLLFMALSVVCLAPFAIGALIAAESEGEDSLFKQLSVLSEVLTLIQTLKIKPFPVALFDTSYWGGLIEWLRRSVLQSKFIDKEDLDLLRLCDSPEEIVDIVQTWSSKHEVTGHKALIFEGDE